MPAIETPYAELIAPGPDYVAGVEFDATIDWQDGAGTLYAAIYNGDTQLGSRQSFTEADDTTTLAFTPNAAGTEWNLRVYDAASGGTLVWQSANFIVLASAAAIEISTTLAATYSPSAVVAVRGSYAGAWSGTGTIQVYDSLNAPVGSATNITSVQNGSWGPTNITLPSDVDTGYYIKAIHADTVTEDDSTAFEIAADAPIAAASFVFEGTGAGADAIALFGHAFAQGLVGATDPVVLRRTDTSADLRTQMNVLSQWPDNSVKTALLAAELPDLADAATLPTNLWVGASHASPGSDLDFATALSGRTAAIRIFSPPNAGSPVETIDPLDGIGSPDWHDGPLAISARREYQLSSGSVGSSSVRLIVDVTATKDGMLYLDVCFSNDRVMDAGGGTATFGFEIVIDGETMYAQKPASGVATGLLQYSQWIRRCGRNAAGTLKVGRGQAREELVYVAPDHDALVASKTMLGYDRVRQMRALEVDAEVNTPLATGNASFLTDPYYNWGKLARQAGAVGGRPEIGYHTFAQYMWLTEGHRNGCILSHRMFEAAATRAMYFYDWELGRWLNPVDWPKMSLTAHTTSPAGTSRATATGLPSEQRPPHMSSPGYNGTDYIGIDHAHHGPMNKLVALLSGRRLAYDSLAARAAWACMDQQDKANGSLGVNSPNWRTLTPDKATGRAWAVRPWQPQTRSWAWDFRDVVHAAIFIPDAYPNATFYKDNAEAWVNSVKDVLPTIQAQWPASVIGLPMIHADGNHLAGFMYSFIFYGGADALRAGVGGANLQEIFEAWATFRVNSVVDGGFPYRSAHAGGDIHMRDGGGAAQTWAEAWAKSQAAGMPTVPEDWSVGMQEGDWQKNVLSGLAIMQDLDLPLAIKAKAADALVLLRSERQGAGGDPHPRTSPDKFVYNTNAMSNRVVGDPRISWEWDTAPVVVPGQSFTVAGDASSGSLIGVVRFTGSIPRNSRGGLTPTTKAWEITSQPAGDPFAISQGGVLSLAGNPPAPDSYTVTVRPRTYNGGLLADGDPSGTLVLGTATDVTVTVTGEPAVITNTTPASPAQIQENVAIGTTIFTFTVAGNLPITAAITSGNTTLFEVTQPSGGTFVLRTKASLIGETGTYPHTIEVDNGIGSPASVNVSTQVVVETDAPVITGGQTFSLPESTSTGGATTPATVAYTGDPAVGAEFTAGNTGSRLGVAVDAGDVEITMALATRRRDVAQLTPTLRLFNAGGEDSKTVTVNITQPWVYAATAPSLHYIGAWSVARRLVDTYTGPLFRVRRSSDNAEQDIGFDSGTGLLDETALTTFVGANNGFVVTLYDQSTEGANLTNATTSTQPQIVSSGAILRAGSNSRPTMLFGSNRRLDYTYATLPVGTVTSFLIAVQMHSSVAGFQRAAAIAEHQLITDGGKPYLVMGNGGEQHTNAASANQAIILYSRHNATIDAGDRNRVGWTGNSIEQSSGGNNSLTTTNAVLTLGTNNLGHNPWPGRISEMVLSRAITVGSEETDLYAAMGTFLGV